MKRSNWKLRRHDLKVICKISVECLNIMIQAFNPPMWLHAPAEAGSFQSARCPLGHSPQIQLASAISLQPLEKKQKETSDHQDH